MLYSVELRSHIKTLCIHFLKPSDSIVGMLYSVELRSHFFIRTAKIEIYFIHPNSLCIFAGMKFIFRAIGKPHESFVKEGTDMFTKRIGNYFSCDWHIMPMPKNAGSMSEVELKKKEGELIFQSLHKDDYLVLLDERGKQMSSEALATFIQLRANESTKNVIFLIGGAYGVSEEVIQRANYKWSLSQLVFPHQLVRLILAEQVYRACTIIKNEKYHHQ